MYLKHMHALTYIIGHIYMSIDSRPEFLLDIVRILNI